MRSLFFILFLMFNSNGLFAADTDKCLNNINKGNFSAKDWAVVASRTNKVVSGGPAIAAVSNGDICDMVYSNYLMYLRARERAGFPAPVKKKEMQFFAENLVANYPVLLKLPRDVYFSNLNIGNKRVETNAIFNSKLAMILPATNENIDIEMQRVSGGRIRVIYSGLFEDSIVQDVAAVKGIELYINSSPDSASVWINKKPYHHDTNTSAAETAGTYKIEIKKDGFRDWVESRTLESGTKWIINAKLDKK